MQFREGGGEGGGEILGWIYKMRGYGMDSERIGLGEGRETRPGFESGVNGSLGVGKHEVDEEWNGLEW